MKCIVVAYLLIAAPVFAQDVVKSEAVQKAETMPEETSGFLDVVKGGGGFGICLWAGLAGLSIAAGTLIIDSTLNIQLKKIIPPTLISLVREAVDEGSMKKAAQRCRDVPGPYSNILLAGFENVDDGFDSAQDAIGIAADMESEKMLQRVNYLNVVGNLAPMLGLLGTVQGMILAFRDIVAKMGETNIVEAAAGGIQTALLTTCFGLIVGIPAFIAYNYFTSVINRYVLDVEESASELMETITLQIALEEQDDRDSATV